VKELEFLNDEFLDKTPFPLINAVLNNLQAGLIMADEDNEFIIFVLHKAGFSYFVRRDETSYYQILKWLLSSKKAPPYFHFYDADKALIKVIDNEREDFNLKIRKRLQLRFDSKVIETAGLFWPPSFSVNKIDEKNFDNFEVFDLGLGDKFWKSKEDFLENGFGFCIFNEKNLPVSICYTACVVNHIAEIDVLTISEYQKRGLAKLAVTSFVIHCIENDITPNWDCFEDNHSSVKTAESVGFKIFNRYKLASVFNKRKPHEKV
jgi:RimJ/RimL family protein N-acetyltransferase